MKPSSNPPHDIFGEALLAFSKGNRLSFVLVDRSGGEHIYSLASRLRSFASLNKTEQELITQSRGCILDVGCGSGNMLVSLAKYGSPVGIDIAENCVNLTRQRGFECFHGDIFSFSPNTLFDTITLFGNGLGMAGSAHGLEMLLQKLAKLLNPGGKILAITRNFDADGFSEIHLTPHWNGKTGDEFTWLIFSHEFLARTCENLGLELQVLSHSWRYRLVEVRRA